MRTKLSVIGAAASHDVEIRCRGPVTLGDLKRALPPECQIVEATQIFSNGKPIAADALVGSAPLLAGAMLSTRRFQAPADATTLRLNIDAGPDAGASFPLSRGQHVVGRSPAADIPVGDPNLSRRHLLIDVGLHAVTIRDLGSTNGTRCAGSEITDVARLLVPDVAVIAGHSQFSLSGAGEPPALIETDLRGRVRVHRPPRQGTRWAARSYEMPDAPPLTPRPRLSWIAAAVPALASAALALAFHSPQLLAFAALSPVMMLGSAFGDRRSWRCTQRDQQREYQTLHARVAAEVEDALAIEETQLRRSHPGPSTLLHSAEGPDCRLWERRRDESNFLRVRVGLGDQDAQTSVQVRGKSATAGVLRMVPAVADLTRGPLGIAGPTESARGVARFIAAQLLSLYSPADLQLIILVSDAASASWNWSRWAEAHLRAVARTDAEQALMMENLVRSMDERLASSQFGNDRWPGPWTVVLVDPAVLAAQLPRVAELVSRGSRVGITAICLADAARGLPADCATTMDVDPDADGWARLSGLERGSSRVGADAVSSDWAERLARALAPLRDSGDSGAASIPTEQRLSDLLGVTSFKPAAICHAWQQDGPVLARIGMAGGGPFDVDLVKDGPHLLIAGTTGSGKSELLRTLVASLACSHSPDRLAFVLVDYKGGAAFAECAEFPHVLGLVTDLDAQLTRRALISLDAELRRREEAFALAGVADLESFHRANHGQQEPLPRLVLVIDEFATLAEELPDFISGLLGIAQRGRSLGVHLVLATQRPAGVLSQDIKANMSLRIALRVTDAAESSDVINDPIACRISRQTPGRAFARRTDGDLVEFQAAGASLPTIDDDHVQIRMLDMWNRPSGRASSAETITELQAVQKALVEASASVSIPPRPWLDPLPDQAVGQPRKGSLKLVLGLLDEPELQRQSPLEHDLAVGGVLALIGGGRSGRTMGLRTMLGIAVAQLNADDLHVYIVDMAGGLGRGAALAHCGTYVDGTDPARIARLISRLGDEAKARRLLLAEWGATGLAETRASGRQLPAVLVLLDGWDAFSASSEEYDAGRSADDTLHLMRDAASVGFSFAVSGDRALLSPRISAVLTRKLLLPLTDASDYGLAGVAPASVALKARPGRGVDTATGAEFQLSMLAAEPNTTAQWEVLTRTARVDDLGIAGPSIILRPLPTEVLLATNERRPGTFLLGRGGDDGSPIYCDLVHGQRQFLITGPARSGKSSAAIMLATQARQSGLSVTVAAPTRSPLTAWAHVTGVALLRPGDMAAGLEGDVVIVDDAEQFLDTPAGEDLIKLVSSDDIAAIVTARSDDLLVSFRGLGVEMRRHRTGVLLQPSSVDGELLGVRLPRGTPYRGPGQGVLVTDLTRGTPDGFTPLQLART